MQHSATVVQNARILTMKITYFIANMNIYTRNIMDKNFFWHTNVSSINIMRRKIHNKYFRSLLLRDYDVIDRIKLSFLGTKMRDHLALERSEIEK